MKLLLLLLLATQGKQVNGWPVGATQCAGVGCQRLIRITSITRGALINNPYAPNGYGVEANTVTSPSIHLSLACDVVLGMEVGQTYFIKQNNDSNYPKYRLVVFTDKEGQRDDLLCIVSQEYVNPVPVRRTQ